MTNKFRAGIFDLDGVITQTASLHSKAWKKMFDAYNDKRTNEGKRIYKAFSLEQDYPKHLDGVPRYDGVRAFLESRNIQLPLGELNDNSEDETIRGLGNWKNDFFQKLIEEEGVEIYEKNIAEIKQWRSEGLKTAVVSSSKNCLKILQSAGLEGLFDIRIDGLIAQEMNLKGKPNPDTFLKASEQLGIPPQESFLVEDATSGVDAGRRGDYKFVVGMNVKNNESELLESGAHVVVNNLRELTDHLLINT